jgi:mRNA-degrading endonuclease RelE of RelBE toxin-antitoxin system
MTTYRIDITGTAFKIFRKFPRYIKKGLIEKTKILKTNPYLGEQLRGKYQKFRSFHISFKNTQYRVIYKIIPDEKSVLIYLVAPRENIYRRMDEMRIE